MISVFKIILKYLEEKITVCTAACMQTNVTFCFLTLAHCLANTCLDSVATQELSTFFLNSLVTQRLNSDGFFLYSAISS